jgi:hypothetical protein
MESLTPHQPRPSQQLRHVLFISCLLALASGSLGATGVQAYNLPSQGDFEGAGVSYSTLFKVYGMFMPINWSATIEDGASGNTVLGTARTGLAATASGQATGNFAISRSGNVLEVCFGGAHASYNWAPDAQITQIMVKVSAVDEATGQRRSVSLAPNYLNGAFSVPASVVTKALDGSAYIAMNHFSVGDFSFKGSSAFSWFGGTPGYGSMAVEFDFQGDSVAAARPLYLYQAPEPSTMLLAGAGLLLAALCRHRFPRRP